ncbi:MAG: hypothetical protein QOK40_2524, partial [Miltoncostaeaceae bacterium]|nr:hypothetical protein [Miltoncostaeaceae bacterium]
MQAFRRRPPEGRSPYLWLGATVEKRRAKTDPPGGGQERTGDRGDAAQSAGGPDA